MLLFVFVFMVILIAVMVEDSSKKRSLLYLPSTLYPYPHKEAVPSPCGIITCAVHLRSTDV